MKKLCFLPLSVVSATDAEDSANACGSSLTTHMPFSLPTFPPSSHSHFQRNDKKLPQSYPHAYQSKAACEEDLLDENSYGLTYYTFLRHRPCT